MKYVKWVLFAIIDLLFNVIAYITNPIIVLFCTPCGQLPELFTWWANWDDGMDVEWMVTEHHVPSFAEYDFNRHYKYVDEWEAEQVIGHHHGFVIPKDMHFTFKEKLQRYVCRLCWIYRNCAYGFSYYVTGIDVYKADVIEVKTDEKDGYTWYVTDYAFCYKDERPSFGSHHWDNFVGWKFRWMEHEKERCMLAIRINPFQ